MAYRRSIYTVAVGKRANNCVSLSVFTVISSSEIFVGRSYSSLAYAKGCAYVDCRRVPPLIEPERLVDGRRWHSPSRSENTSLDHAAKQTSIAMKCSQRKTPSGGGIPMSEQCVGVRSR